MQTPRVLPGAIVVGAVAVASLFAAAPASAATLPSGQKITVVDANTWQFSEASPVDAALTPVGEAPGVLPFDEYVVAVDVDDDGHGYGFTQRYVQVKPNEPCPEEEFCPPWYEADGAVLWEADATTGTLSTPIDVQVLVDSEEEPVWEYADECLAIDYSGGTILAACSIDTGEGGWVAYIGSVDPDTARLYPDTILGGEDFIQFQAIALNPVDGLLWGFASDTSAWVITLDGELPDSPGDTEMSIYAADFDRAGVIWVSAYRPDIVPLAAIEPGEEGLAILNLDNGEFEFDARWSDEDAVIDSLTVWGKPALANTGATASAAPVVVASGVLLLGALLAAGAMALRRRDA